MPGKVPISLHMILVTSPWGVPPASSLPLLHRCVLVVGVGGGLILQVSKGRCYKEPG